MKHKSIFLVFILLLTLTACTQTPVNYKIVRTDFVKGRYMNFEWILQNDSVKVIEYPMSSDPDSIVCYKPLTERQSSRLQNIIQDIDLSALQNSYSNDLVQGEGHSVYNITIGDQSKNIYVYYVDVPELKKIDEFLFDVTADCK